MIVNRISIFIRIASQKKALNTAVIMAVLVGLILNLINQGQAILALNFAQINYPKFFLTFLVPFSVSLYSSTTTKLKFYTGELAFVEAELMCKKCRNFTQNVQPGEKVKTCPECERPTAWKPLHVNTTP